MIIAANRVDVLEITLKAAVAASMAGGGASFEESLKKALAKDQETDQLLARERHKRVNLNLSAGGDIGYVTVLYQHPPNSGTYRAVNENTRVQALQEFVVYEAGVENRAGDLITQQYNQKQQMQRLQEEEAAKKLQHEAVAKQDDEKQNQSTTSSTSNDMAAINDLAKTAGVAVPTLPL